MPGKKERTNADFANFDETNNALLYSAIVFAICFLYRRSDGEWEKEKRKERKEEIGYAMPSDFLQIASVCKFLCYTHHLNCSPVYIDFLYSYQLSSRVTACALERESLFYIRA